MLLINLCFTDKTFKNCAVLPLDTLTSLFDQIYIQRDLIVFDHADTLI